MPITYSEHFIGLFTNTNNFQLKLKKIFFDKIAKRTLSYHWFLFRCTIRPSISVWFNMIIFVFFLISLPIIGTNYKNLAKVRSELMWFLFSVNECLEKYTIDKNDRFQGLEPNMIAIFWDFFLQFEIYFLVFGQTTDCILECEPPFEAENYRLCYWLYKWLQNLIIMIKFQIYRRFQRRPPLSWA